MTRPAPILEPRGLNREQAALYVGVGATLFDLMVHDGRMPGPKSINSRKVWDRRELDLAFNNLPNADQAASEANPFDGVAA